MSLKEGTMRGGGGRCRAVALSAGGSVFLDLKQGDFAGAVDA